MTNRSSSQSGRQSTSTGDGSGKKTESSSNPQSSRTSDSTNDVSHPDIIVNGVLMHDDDVSSIQVGESVVGDPSATTAAVGSNDKNKTSTQELDMLFAVPESQEVIATEADESAKMFFAIPESHELLAASDSDEPSDDKYSVQMMPPTKPSSPVKTPSKKQKTKLAVTPSPKSKKPSKKQKIMALVSPSSKKKKAESKKEQSNNTVDSNQKEQSATTKSTSGDPTILASNTQPDHSLGVSACTYLSLLVANPGIKDASTEQIVRDTLLCQVGLLPQNGPDTKKKKSKKKKEHKRSHSLTQLPVDVDDVSFVDESVEQVIAATQECVREGHYSEAIDLYMGLLVTQRKKANTEAEMAFTLSGLTVLHLLKKDPVRALRCANEALKLTRESNDNGQHNESIATCLAQVGTVHFCADYVHQAQVAWRESLQIACKVLGYSHAHVALLLNNIACAHFQSGKNLEALATFQESLSLQRNGLGASSENADAGLLHISCTLSNMAMVSAQRRQYSTAIALLEEALLLQESALPSENTSSRSVDVARHHLRRWMQLKDQSPQPAMAEDLHVVRKMRRKDNEPRTVFGDSDGIPMRTTIPVFQDNLDIVLLGSLVKEWTCTQRVKESILNNFETMSPAPTDFVPKLPNSDNSSIKELVLANNGWTCNPQIVTDGIQKNFESKPIAPEDLTLALSMSQDKPNDKPNNKEQKSYIPVDLDGGNVMDAELHLQDIYQLAMTHLKYNEIEEAMDLFESVLRNHKEKYGDVHHLVGTAVHNIGIVQLYAQKYDAALERFQEAINIRTAALGPDHPNVSASLLKKGMVQLAKEDLDGAHVTFCQVLHLQRKVHGYNHVAVAKVLNNIGCVHYEFGGLLASLKALEEALEIQRRHFAEALKEQNSESMVSSQQQLAIANTLCNIGFVLYKRKEFDRSIVVYQEALDIQKKFFSATEQLRNLTTQNLAHTMATCNAMALQERNVAIEKLTLMYMDMLKCGS